MTLEALSRIISSEMDTETRIEDNMVFFEIAGIELIAKKLSSGGFRIFSIIHDSETSPELPDVVFLRVLNDIQKDIPYTKCVLLGRDDDGTHFRICVEFQCEEDLSKVIDGYIKALMKALLRLFTELYNLTA